MGRYKANQQEHHLYFLSKDNMNNKTLYPRVPENYFTKNGYEDNTTKRVCFATSIDKALMAISMRMKGMILYVHTPKDTNIEIYKPTIKQVPDCSITGETWVTQSVELKCIGKIKVINDKGLDGHKFKYGDKEAELYDWNWEWIEHYKEVIKENKDTINYINSNDFKDIEKVINSLSDEERKELAPNGPFKDTPNTCIYKKAYKNGNDNAGFIYIDSYEDKSKAYIGIAVSPKYRGKGLSKIMVDDAIHYLSNKKIKKLLWITIKNNISSNKLANKLGFRKYDSYKQFNQYEYILKKNTINESTEGINRIDFKKKYPKGFFGKDLNNPKNKKGIWNSIKWKGNKMLRERSEVLILKDNKIFIAPSNKYYPYTLPGGSLEPDIGIVETSIKESQEEARINVKNVRFLETYEDDRKSNWDIILNDDENVKIKYDGCITYVCVAEYNSKYDGYISVSDVDDKVSKGEFKSIDKINLRDIHKKALDKYKEKSINENLLISDKDFNNNLEKWTEGNYPVLLITGLSGGGKTTLAKQLAKEYKADIVELDMLEYNHNNSKNNFLKKFMESDSKYHQYNHISEYWKNDNESKDKLIKTIKEYIHFCVSYALKNNIKVIIEGIQIYQLMYTKEDLIYMTDKPIIIIGTSPLISKLRQFKRIIDGGNGGQTLRTLIQDNKYLDEFRKDIKSTIKEDKEYDHILFPKSEIESLKERLNNDQPIYTTRVSSEYDKYKQGEIYNSNLGCHLKVININKFRDINEHPFYNELNGNQIRILSKYNKFDLIKLEKINSVKESDDNMGVWFNTIEESENMQINNTTNVIEEAYLLTEGSVYQKKYKCVYCDDRLERQKLINHIIDKHEDFIPENYTATRVVFNLVNKKEKGTCVICGKETLWDENKAKYDRFCCEKCVQEYVHQRNESMMRTKGKLYVTDDPEFQKKMLANRKISGEYTWSDGIKRSYTGSYEKKLLVFLDKVMGFKSCDVVTPGATVYYKDNEGKDRAWILDDEITPYNLQIDVKDGGDNPNNREMPEYRDKQLAKERSILSQKKYNYLRLTNNNFGQLLTALAQIKMNLLDNNEDKIWNINEYMSMSGVSPITSKGPDSKPVSYIVPCMVQNTFVEPLYSRDEFMEKLYRIVDGKLVLTNKAEVSKQFDVSNKLLKSSVAEKMKYDIDELITKESYVDHNIMFEKLTGHKLLDKNQYFFDENLNVVLDGFYKSKIRRDIIEATFSNLLNEYKVSICESAHNLHYSNLSLQRDINGFFAYNESTKKRTESYEIINEIPDEVLELLNDDDFFDGDDEIDELCI